MNFRRKSGARPGVPTMRRFSRGRAPARDSQKDPDCLCLIGSHVYGARRAVLVREDFCVTNDLRSATAPRSMEERNSQ